MKKHTDSGVRVWHRTETTVFRRHDPEPASAGNRAHRASQVTGLWHIDLALDQAVGQ